MLSTEVLVERAVLSTEVLVDLDWYFAVLSTEVLKLIWTGIALRYLISDHCEGVSGNRKINRIELCTFRRPGKHYRILLNVW